ncbi:MAG: H(+)-transporting V1 sector ATPase subunit G [Geoglossum umbratile]|nr:MAG: H(+)-transporting V1 sector ATPase subunit G [Geoglossum umbratile]
MSAQNSAGIQTLLDAEREAQKIVQKAREYRTKRVKDARSEAQKEIEEYRKAKSDEFKRFEKEHTSGNRQAEEEADNRAKEECDTIQGLKTAKEGIQIAASLANAVTEPGT